VVAFPSDTPREANSARFVGRVGALAFALGVGFALTPAVAFADTGVRASGSDAAVSGSGAPVSSVSGTDSARRSIAGRRGGREAAPAGDSGRRGGGSSVVGSISAARSARAADANAAGGSDAAAAAVPVQVERGLRAASIPTSVASASASSVSAPSAARSVARAPLANTPMMTVSPVSATAVGVSSRALSPGGPLEAFGLFAWAAFREVEPRNGVGGVSRAPVAAAAVGSSWSVVPTGTNNSTGTVTGSASFTDPNRRTLSYSAPLTSTGGGAVSVNATTGAWTYTPTQAQRYAATSSTTDSFTLTATYNGAVISTKDVPIPGTWLVGTPVAGLVTPSAPVNATGAVSGSVAFSDPAGRTFTYSAPVTSAGGGTVSVNPTTGAFTYTPTQVQRRGATGSTTDTFTITAGNGVNSSPKTVTVSVDAGIPVAGSATPGSPVNASGAVSGSVSFSDPAGRTLSYSAPVTSAGGGTVSVNATTGGWTFTPTQVQRRAATGSTTDTFTITAGNGVKSSTKTVTVSVDAGTPVAGSATPGSPVNASGAVSGSVSFTDPAGRTLSYSAPATSTGGGTVSVNATTGAWTYTPTQVQRRAATGSTTDTFTITAGNGVKSSTKTVTVTVDAGTPVVGSASSGSPDDATGAVSGSVAFTDPAGRTLSYSSLATSAGGGTVSVNATTGAFTYTPTQAQRQAATGSTTDTFTITANNGVNSTPQLVTVSVSAKKVAAPPFNSVVGTIAVGSGGRGVAFSPDGTRAYVTNQFNNSVSVINTADNSVVTITGFSSPLGVAAYGTQAYVVNQGNMYGTPASVTVISTVDNSVVATIALPSGVQPSQVAFSPDGTRAYVTDAQSSANGRVVVINTVDRSVSTITGLGINPEAVAAFGSRLYVTNYYGTVGLSTGSVSVVDTSANNAVIADIVVGRQLPGRPYGYSACPIRVALSPDGTRAYVANVGDGTVSVINTGTNEVLANVVVGDPNAGFGVESVAVSSDGATAYALIRNGGTSKMVVIKTADNTVTNTFALGAAGQVFAVNMAISPDGSRAYVTSVYGGIVTVVGRSVA